MCSFNRDCSRVSQSFSSGEHRPTIRKVGECGCPLPHAVAEIGVTKGDYLFHQGETVRGGFSLTAGLVALERVNEDGDVVILKVLRPGAFFPYADVFGDGQHAASARALTMTAACFIPTERLMAAMADAGLRTKMMRQAAAEARENEDIIYRLCAADLGERVLTVLRQLAGDGAALDLPISWRDVAAMVGTSPEVISRTLRKLAEAGELTFKGRHVDLSRGHRVDRLAANAHPHGHAQTRPHPSLSGQGALRRGA
jgi:CRP-like cAMP-binding protein